MLNITSYRSLNIHYATPFSDCIIYIFWAWFPNSLFVYTIFYCSILYIISILSIQLQSYSLVKWLKSRKLCVSSRPPERKSIYLNHSPERESCHVPPSPTVPVSVTPPSPVAMQTSSIPMLKPGTHSCQDSASVRKRRRLAASPGGLHWNASGTVCYILGTNWKNTPLKCLVFFWVLTVS